MKLSFIFLNFVALSFSARLAPKMISQKRGVEHQESDDNCVRECWRELVRKDYDCTLQFENLSPEYYLCIEKAMLEYQNCIVPCFPE